MSLQSIEESTTEYVLDHWDDVVEWLEKIIQTKNLTQQQLWSSDPQESVPKDGIIFIRAMNSVYPGSIPFYHSIPPQETTKGKMHPMMERENLNFYIEACWKIGVSTHNILKPSHVIDSQWDIIIHNIMGLSQAAHFYGVHSESNPTIPLLPNNEPDGHSIALLEFLPEDSHFDGNEDLELQATLCHMVKEVLESLVHGNEVDMTAVDAITDNAFAVDVVRRVFVYLLRNMVFTQSSPSEVELSSNAFSVVATMSGALLEDLRTKAGGDYFTTKLIFSLSFYLKTCTEGKNGEPGEDIYLQEVIREHPIWEEISFWSEFFWDSAAATLARVIKKKVVCSDDEEIYADDEKVLLYELLLDHVTKMYEWGKFSGEVLIGFMESVRPYIDVSEDETQLILEHVLSPEIAHEALRQQRLQKQKQKKQQKESEGRDCSCPEESDEDSEDEKKGTLEEEEIDEFFAEIFQLKITIKKQEQHIKNLEDTLTQQFIQTISVSASPQVQPSLEQAQRTLQRQLQDAAAFKSGIKEIQEMIPKTKALAQQTKQSHALKELQSLHNEINEKVSELLHKSRKMVSSEVLAERKNELRSRSELLEISNDVEDALKFFLDTSSDLISDPSNTDVVGHMVVVSKEFDLALSDFISTVDKVIIELRLELSGEVIETIVCQLQGEISTLKQQNSDLKHQSFMNQKSEQQELEQERNRVRSLDKQLEEAQATIQTTKNSETLLLAERLKLLQEQTQYLATIRQINESLQDKDKAYEELKQQFEQQLKKLTEESFTRRGIKSRRTELSPQPLHYRSKLNHRSIQHPPPPVEVRSESYDLSQQQQQQQQQQPHRSSIRVPPSLTRVGSYNPHGRRPTRRVATEKFNSLQLDPLKFPPGSFDLSNWRISINLPSLTSSELDNGNGVGPGQGRSLTADVSSLTTSTTIPMPTIQRKNRPNSMLIVPPPKQRQQQQQHHQQQLAKTTPQLDGSLGSSAGGWQTSKPKTSLLAPRQLRRVRTDNGMKEKLVTTATKKQKIAVRKGLEG